MRSWKELFVNVGRPQASRPWEKRPLSCLKTEQHAILAVKLWIIQRVSN
jgi:hypothetical protein